MLTKCTVVIISQYLHISNHYVVHVTLTQCYVNFISTDLEKINEQVYTLKKQTGQRSHMPRKGMNK